MNESNINLSDLLNFPTKLDLKPKKQLQKEPNKLFVKFLTPFSNKAKVSSKETSISNLLNNHVLEDDIYTKILHKIKKSRNSYSAETRINKQTTTNN